MRTQALSPLCSIAAILAAAVALAAQQRALTVRIVSPAEGAYVSGPTRLVVVFDPPSVSRRVNQVTFFAGAKQVCRVVRAPFECDWDAGEGVHEHTVRVVARLQGGGTLNQTVRTRGIDFAETVDVDVVQVTPVVTDRDGRFVKGLQKSDFVIYEDDKPQEITNFASENIPLEMVTTLDISGSMQDALASVKEHAKRFLSGLQPRDQVTVLAFNESPFTLARRETDQAARARAIDRMAPWGGPALYDVIINAVDLLGRQSGRRSILLFSDGDDQSSYASLEEAISRTEGSDATIYAIGQGRAVESGDLQKLMTRLARVSGGRAFFTNDPDRLSAIFNEILEDLRNQYLLAYPAPSTQRDGKWHAIRVEAGKHSVRARQGYRLRPR
jgi:VWFA-related protein